MPATFEPYPPSRFWIHRLFENTTMVCVGCGRIVFLSDHQPSGLRDIEAEKSAFVGLRCQFLENTLRIVEPNDKYARCSLCVSYAHTSFDPTPFAPGTRAGSWNLKSQDCCTSRPR
jgi:hypothetical protein